MPEADRKHLLALRSLLAEQRAAARAWLLEALDSRRYESFVSRFGRALRARPRRGAGPWSVAAREAAPELIESRFASFRKAARRIGADSPPDDYHRLRIKGKRLRYTLEFLGDLYPDDTKPLVKRLTALQDILGEHHDAVVAIERLRDLAAIGDDRLSSSDRVRDGRDRGALPAPRRRARAGGARRVQADHRKAMEGTQEPVRGAAAELSSARELGRELGVRDAFAQRRLELTLFRDARPPSGCRPVLRRSRHVRRRRL